MDIVTELFGSTLRVLKMSCEDTKQTNGRVRDLGTALVQFAAGAQLPLEELDIRGLYSNRDSMQEELRQLANAAPRLRRLRVKCLALRPVVQDALKLADNHAAVLAALAM